MKKLHIYVFKEIGRAFIPAFLVLNLIMVLGLCIQLLNEGLNVVSLATLLPHVFVYSVPVVLPSAFLTAAIMAFGRLSADNELTAVRVAGIHLRRLVVPVCALAAVLSVLAAVFQFEVVPGARKRMRLLQCDALKQILIGRVALSANRQFSHDPFHIRYRDFRDGKMHDLVVLVTESGVAKTIITASTGTIETDPARRESVFFKLEDCMVTSLDSEELGGTGTLSSREIELPPLDVAPNVEYLESHPKYMNVRSLVRLVRTLREEVAQHPKRFRNPAQVVADARARIRDKKIEIDELNDLLAHTREELSKDTEERRRIQNQIKLDEDNKQKSKELLKSLVEQQKAYQKEIGELARKAEKEELELEKEVELRKELSATKSRIETAKSHIEQADRRIKEAERKLDSNSLKAADVAEDIAHLEKEKDSLMSELMVLADVRKKADRQKDYRSAQVRIHKRLVTSMAVLVFSMIGIPLSIMFRRRNVIVALGIAFAIVLFLFYPFLILGQVSAEMGFMPVVPSMWAGNGLTLLIGVFLMGKVLAR